MTARTKPPFRADQVGSLIRTDILVFARKAWKEHELSDHELHLLQEREVAGVVKMQEDLGFKAVTDGEYNRESWQTDFLLKFENVTQTPTTIEVEFRFDTGETRGARPPTMKVTGKLGRPAKGIFVEDFKALAKVAKAMPKLTIPSPSTMHFRGGRGAVDQTAYPDMEEFYADLSRVYREEIAALYAAGCRYLQLDEVNLAYLCDPSLHNQVRSLGLDPVTLPKLYARIINEALRDKPADMTVAMHLCRGNYAGSWVAQGGYEPIADLLFNEINIDGYFMEYDSARAGGFEPLRFLPKGKTAVLGLVTTKSPKLESKDELKRRVEEASKHTALDQLALSPQCGFASGVGGFTMSIEEEKAKLGLIVETAREIWGD